MSSDKNTEAFGNNSLKGKLKFIGITAGRLLGERVKHCQMGDLSIAWEMSNAVKI